MTTPADPSMDTPVQLQGKGFRIEAPLGDLAIARGFVTEAQVRECLDTQAEFSRGGINKRLGDIFIEKKHLLPHQLDLLVQEQAGAPNLKRVKNYDLLEKLGEGGMGTVLKARRSPDGQMVALKLLFQRLASDPNYIKRFQREAEIGIDLEHPNLVKCLEFGESDGFHFMALEFVDGTDLSRHLMLQSYFPEAQALAIILAAARGMSAAHAAGLVHRDVKPANIMLTGDGGVKVMDFGLARVSTDLERQLTVTGALMGTPHYMSPEQIDNKKELDARSDMYCLGTTFFHMLTGRPPYVDGSLYDILNAHLTRNIPDPRKFNHSLSRETALLVKWMCEREREKRLPSMDELVRETGRLLGMPSAMSDPVPLGHKNVAPSKLSELSKTQSKKIAEDARCPRCHEVYKGDLSVVIVGQRLRCEDCGLLYPSPVTARPMAMFPDVIEFESTPEEAASRDVVFEEAPPSGSHEPLAPPKMPLTGRPRISSGPAVKKLSEASVDVVVPAHSDPHIKPAVPPPPREDLALENESPATRVVHELETQETKAPDELNRQLKTGLWWLIAAAILGLVVWIGKTILSGKLDSYLK